MQNCWNPLFLLQKYLKYLFTSLNQKLHQVGMETVTGRGTAFHCLVIWWHCIQKKWAGGVPFLNTARVILGDLTWEMSTSCLPSLVAAFFWALVGVWSVLELTSDEMLELPLPAKGKRNVKSGKEGTNVIINWKSGRYSTSQYGMISGSFTLSLKHLMCYSMLG